MLKNRKSQLLHHSYTCYIYPIFSTNKQNKNLIINNISCKQKKLLLFGFDDESLKKGLNLANRRKKRVIVESFEYFSSFFYFRIFSLFFPNIEIENLQKLIRFKLKGNT